MKNILIILFACIPFIGWSQTAYQSTDYFINAQRSFPRPADAMTRKEDTLMKQFKEKGLQWPAKYIYIRSFKYDSQLEVWVKNERSKPFKLFKVYKVCAMAGTLGPKRMQGDYQVPEGFYYVNELNPRSMYHLSLGLNYPNASDRLLADSLRPGGDIYIHGSCVTTGCIPIMDAQVEELYILAAHAKNLGQDFIPVHIYPGQFKVKKSSDYITKYMDDFPGYNSLASRLKEVYYYFEKNKQLPVIMVDPKGRYILDEDVKKEAEQAMKEGTAVEAKKPEKKVIVKKTRVVTPFDEKDIPASVNNLPVYPGGSEAFQAFLHKLSKDLAVYLTEEQRSAFVQVEFIVDKQGNVINPKIIRGGNDEMNEKILDAFEAMPAWKPAIRLEQPVPMKLKQTIAVE